jgi:hypothetical protein
MIRKFTMDWSLNIGNVVTIMMFLLAGIGAWYDVKSDVKLNHQEAAIKFQQVESFMKEQKSFNDYSERQRDLVMEQLKASIREDTRELKVEIRELRTDLFRTHPPGSITPMKKPQ